MATNWGSVPLNSVIPFFFDSFAGSTGASITLTGLAATDIEVYKGTSMTQRASDAGFTLLDTDGIDVDGITGIHGFSIDTSDNTDAGFYTAGSFYTVIVSSVTIDSQTVSFVAGTFRLLAAEHTAGYPVSTIKDGTGTGEIDTSSGGVLVSSIANGAITAAAIATDAIDADAIAADAIAEIADAVWDEDATGHQTQGTFGQAIGDPGADTDTIWGLVNTNLDAAVSTRASQTSLDTVDDFLDTEVAAILAAVDTEVAAIKAKTDSLTFSTANRVDSQVFGMEAGTVTATAVATGAIDADALAADAVDEIWDEVMEGTTTARQSVRLANSANASKLSGAATTTVTVRDIGDTKDRIVATVDADGNRSAITLDVT